MKKNISILVVALLTVCNIAVAQHKDPHHSLGLKRATGVCTANIGLEINALQPEYNALPIFEELKMIKGNDNVEVCIFIDDNKKVIWEKESKGATPNNYTWVVTTDELKELEKRKKINLIFEGEDAIMNFKEEGKDENYFRKKYNLGKEEMLAQRQIRIAQLLGVDTTASVRPKYVCVFKVNKESLLRPAYNISVEEIIETPKDGTNIYNWKTNDNAIEELQLAYFQNNNTYPWTRMGYTYDWYYSHDNADNNIIGLSEFLVKPNSTMVGNLVIYTISAPK